MAHDGQTGDKEAEQIQLARDIGAELTDAFVAFVRGRVGFDELTFGVFDALHDLHVVASGEYELEERDHDHDHDHDHEHDFDYDDNEHVSEQEELAQEPSRDEPER